MYCSTFHYYYWLDGEPIRLLLTHGERANVKRTKFIAKTLCPSQGFLNYQLTPEVSKSHISTCHQIPSVNFIKEKSSKVILHKFFYSIFFCSKLCIFKDELKF